jgi:alpha-tubulin suppressor-like RCC1 family protein
MRSADYTVVSTGSLGQNTFYLSANRELFVCGHNEYGQLGIGNTTPQSVPQRFPTPGNHRVISISSGTRHSAIVTVEGKLYGFGHNDKRQISSNTSQEKIVNPYYIQHHCRFIAVSCGNNHTLALTNTFEVYSFGSNDFGQLGCGPRANPGLNKVDLPERIVSIVAGHDHSVALSESGKLYVWGCGTSGQLGLEHSSNINRPEEFTGIQDRVVKVACGYMHTAVISDKGDLFVFGFIHNELKYGNSGKLIKSFPPNDPVVSLASGSTHLLVLTATGFVYGYGINGYGQLGVDGTPRFNNVQDISSLRGRKIVQIATGFQHSVVLTSAGQALAFGRNEKGQLGVGHNKLQPTPAQVVIPGVNTIQDIFNLSQHTQLIDASQVSEEIVQDITLPPPSNYHPDYHLQFQQGVQTSDETNLSLPQSFSIIGRK